MMVVVSPGDIAGDIYSLPVERTYRKMARQLPEIPSNMVRLYSYRPMRKGYMKDSLSDLAILVNKILVNNKRVGSVHPNTFFFVDRPPGSYDITLTYEGTEIGADIQRRRLEKRDALHVDLKAGQTAYARVEYVVGLLASLRFEVVEPAQASVEIQSVGPADTPF